jgi:hypothetical protein
MLLSPAINVYYRDDDIDFGRQSRYCKLTDGTHHGLFASKRA